MNHFRDDNIREYKGYRYEIFYGGPHMWIVICNGHEICSGYSPKNAEKKFHALIDSGLVIKPRVIGE